MTYGEIEFLDDHDEPPLSPPRAPVAPKPGLVSTLSVLGWLAAAVLALLAPFCDFYRIVERAPAETDLADAGFTFSVDGWGRLVSGSGGVSNGHAIRFGIGLCVCAGLFVLVGVGQALADRHIIIDSAKTRRRLAIGAVAASSLFGGLLASVFLSIESYVSAYAAASSDPTQSMYHLHLGAFTWLCCAALACAIAATVAQFRALPPATTPEPAPATPDPEVASGRL